MDAAGAAGVTRGSPPNSRRVYATAVQANGEAAGESPLPPEANHDRRLAPTTRKPTVGAVITGAVATAGAAAISTVGAAEAVGAGSLGESNESDSRASTVG